MRAQLVHRLLFDLADALGRDVVFAGQCLQGRFAVFVQPACLDDGAAARVKRLQAFRQFALHQVFVFGVLGVLCRVDAVICQPL